MKNPKKNEINKRLRTKLNLPNRFSRCFIVITMEKNLSKMRTKAVLHFVKDEMGVALNGGEFSEFFEGSRANRSKWQRLIDGIYGMSERTLNNILLKASCKAYRTQLASEIKEIYYSNIWWALDTKDRTEAQWDNLFESFPENIQQLFEQKTLVPPKKLSFDTLNRSAIDKLTQSCSLDALACLVAYVNRYSQIEETKLIGLFIQGDIYQLMTLFLRQTGWYAIHKEMFSIIEKDVLGIQEKYEVISPELQMIWRDRRIRLTQDLQFYSIVVELMQRIFRLETREQERHFLYKCLRENKLGLLKLLKIKNSWPELAQEDVRFFNNFARSLNKNRRRSNRIKHL